MATLEGILSTTENVHLATPTAVARVIPRQAGLNASQASSDARRCVLGRDISPPASLHHLADQVTYDAGRN